MVYRGKVSLGEHPPILERELFDPAETRATLVRAIALAAAGSTSWSPVRSPGPEAITQAAKACSRRHVVLTISLAFLAPDLVQAAVEGRLPRGVGIARLIDPPIEWQRGWQMLGLQL